MRNNERIFRGGGPLYSLKRHVDYLVRSHQSENAALRGARYRRTEFFIKTLLGTRSLLILISQYLVFVFLITICEAFVINCWGIFYPSAPLLPIYGSEMATKIEEALASANDLLLSAQATLIGIVFPLAVGLITILLQREDVSSTESDIKIYYHEGQAYEVGISCIALIMAITIQYFWPMNFIAHQLGYGSAEQPHFKMAITILHAGWFLINCIGLWHFLSVSLDYTKPARRLLYRKRYAANVVVPNELRKHLITNIYMNAVDTIAKDLNLTDMKHTKLISGYSTVASEETEATIKLQRPSKLVDVRMLFLKLIIKRWVYRSELSVLGEGETNYLTFPIEIGREFKGTVAVCTSKGSQRLTKLERRLACWAFKFKEV